MRGRTGDIAIAYAMPSQYLTSLPTKSPTNNESQQVPRYLLGAPRFTALSAIHQAGRVPTYIIYSEHPYVVARDPMITDKIYKFWKFHEFVEACGTGGTSDLEGALSSNISRYVYFSNLMTPV